MTTALQLFSTKPDILLDNKALHKCNNIIISLYAWNVTKAHKINEILS